MIEEMITQKAYTARIIELALQIIQHTSHIALHVSATEAFHDGPLAASHLPDTPAAFRDSKASRQEPLHYIQHTANFMPVHHPFRLLAMLNSPAF